MVYKEYSVITEIINENSDEILPSKLTYQVFYLEKKISFLIESSIEYLHLKSALNVYFPLKLSHCHLNIKIFKN